MDACLSFTTVSIFTDTDTYTDHNSGTYGWLALEVAIITLTKNVQIQIFLRTFPVLCSKYSSKTLI